MQPYNIIVSLFCLLVSCNSTDKSSYSGEDHQHKLDWLSRNFDEYYNYRYYNVNLSKNYTALDLSGKEIDKKEFLNLLATGNFLPIKTDESPSYQLFALPEDAEESVKRDIKYVAEKHQLSLGFEGTILPPFHLSDTYNNVYNNMSIEGKIVLIKCWFISCVACVEEFPTLNDLVAQNTGRDDIAFLSFALDKPAQLKSFFEKKPLHYTNLADAENYLHNALLVDSYPTHILLDKSSRIVKYVWNIDDVIPAFEELKATD